MTKNIVTSYMGISTVSGVQAEEKHHLIWGRGGALRSLADEDGLIMPLTTREHTGAAGGKVIERIHDNPMAEHLSKMLGQIAWEKEFYRRMTVAGDADPARNAFRKRYGESFL